MDRIEYFKDAQNADASIVQVRVTAERYSTTRKCTLSVGTVTPFTIGTAPLQSLDLGRAVKVAELGEYDVLLQPRRPESVAEHAPELPLVEVVQTPEPAPAPPAPEASSVPTPAPVTTASPEQAEATALVADAGTTTDKEAVT